MDSIGSILHPPFPDKQLISKDASTLCLQRISTIQEYLVKNQFDGLLAVNGIDSRYHQDSRHLTNFLLFGCSLYKDGNYRKYFEIDTDELVIFITPSNVHVYTNQPSLGTILPFLTRIQNLNLHCLDVNMSVEEATVEDHKIHSFINMTNGSTNIAIPHDSRSRVTFDHMLVEKWPLIQAYALEDYGSQGFFGLNHQLQPFDFASSNVFKTYDSGSLIHLLNDTSILLKYQWSMMIRNVSNMIKSDKPIDLKMATDPIISFVEHTLDHAHCRSDKVAFDLTKHAVTSEPLYVACSMRDPRGSLSFGRTYFFHLNTDSSDLVMLSAIYDAMVHVSHRTIHRFIAAQSTSKLNNYFLKKFQERLSTVYKYPQLGSFKSSVLKVSVNLQAFDVRGNKTEALSSGCLRTLSVTVGNISSLQKPQFVYDPLVLQDSFVDSVVQVTSDNVTGIDSDCLIVTSPIPAFVQWNKFDENQAGLVPCSLISSETSPYEAWFRFEGCYFEILSPFSTPLLIRISDIRSIKVKKTGMVAVALQIEHSSNCLPPFTKRFCLVFWQRGKGYKFACETLLPALKEGDIVEKPEPFPSDTVLRLENLISSKIDPTIGSAGIKSEVNVSCYPTYATFESHFKLSSLGKFTYDQTDINPNLAPNIKDPSIFITILIGTPGSNQEKVCSIITESEQENNPFIVLRQPLGASKLFSADDLQTTLLNLANQGGELMRILLIVSAYIEVVEVVGAVTHHPDKATREACYISSVNTCIDVRNLFLCNHTCFPKVIEQCREGWVNNLVVSGLKQKGKKDERLGFIRKLNPQCNVIEVISNSYIDGAGIDSICSPDDFNTHTLAITRHITCPGWYSRQYVPKPPFLDISHMSISFPGALCKARFMSQLKTLHQKEGRVFVDRLVMAGSVFYLGGRASFVEDMHVYNIECTPRSNAISLTTVTKSLPRGTKNCFTFTGYQLSRDQVISWLESCATRAPSARAPLTAAALSEREKKDLRGEAAKEKLPEGWFYNGTSYVSMLEGKKTEHPLYQTCVDKYLAKRNREIVESNQEIEKMGKLSIFDGM